MKDEITATISADTGSDKVNVEICLGVEMKQGALYKATYDCLEDTPFGIEDYNDDSWTRIVGHLDRNPDSKDEIVNQVVSLINDIKNAWVHVESGYPYWVITIDKEGKVS